MKLVHVNIMVQFGKMVEFNQYYIMLVHQVSIGHFIIGMDKHVQMVYWVKKN
eukprot:CAMPEP_0114659600 /NCGR_PEP_ID=MMETSP0191-20121206/18195_1 /TAXON_ID=126664 /ORGANISM="Sorites sp." /LENGTH=51 /DNA_ID=CAMNT_0001885355 /DNA_START=722 /DNA_END=877 /DNA_ORIENTATION=+